MALPGLSRCGGGAWNRQDTPNGTRTDSAEAAGGNGAERRVGEEMAAVWFFFCEALSAQLRRLLRANGLVRLGNVFIRTRSVAPLVRPLVRSSSALPVALL